MIENDWRNYTIADIGLFVGGATPSTASPKFWNGDIPWATTRRLGSSFIVSSGEQFITKEGLQESSTNVLPNGNLLVGTRVGVGKVGVNTIDIAISQDLTGILVDRRQFDSLFLAFRLSRPDVQADIRRRARGVTIKGIPRDDLKLVPFTAPNRVVQVKVAATLLRVQEGLELEERLIAAARELKQSAMRQLFTRGLHGGTPQETAIGPLPENWSVKPLADLRAFLQYGTSSKCDYDQTGNPVLRIPNIAGGRIDCSDVKSCNLDARDVESWLLEPGDVLFVRTNGVRARVGTCAVYRGQPERALFASYLIRARLRTEELNPEFFQYYTDTAVGVSLLGGRASPAADGKFNINTKTLDSLLVPVPAIEEQLEIAGILDTIDRKISVHTRKRAALQDLFNTLLHELMTGHIRVADLDIDVSDVATEAGMIPARSGG